MAVVGRDDKAQPSDARHLGARAAVSDHDLIGDHGGSVDTVAVAVDYQRAVADVAYRGAEPEPVLRPAGWPDPRHDEPAGRLLVEIGEKGPTGAPGICRGRD